MFLSFMSSKAASSMGKGKSPRGGGGAHYMLDRSLVSRVEQLSSRTDVTDIDGVVEQLRRTYKEYQRKQVAALRQMVTRAVQVLREKGSLKSELQLQVGERTMLACYTTTALLCRCSACHTDTGAGALPPPPAPLNYYRQVLLAGSSGIGCNHSHLGVEQCSTAC